MSSKRKLEETSSQETPEDATDLKRYQHNGHKNITKQLQTIPVMDIRATTPDTFFRDFVSKRRPCILISSDHDDDNDNIPGCSKLRRSELVPALRRLAGTKTVQVEKRSSSQEAFGQNRTTTRQMEMTLNSFLDAMTTTTTSSTENAEMLYLSPQQHVQKGSLSGDSSTKVNDDDKQESTSPADRPGDPFSTPCYELLQEESIPRHLEWAGNLILHQCNLWMGHSKDGSSSGLHNDFHDNFYLLVQGRKRFRLYAPQNAPNMYTYGTIQRIHTNGLCSYVGNELRSDGAPLAMLPEFEGNVMGNNDYERLDDDNDGKDKDEDDEEDEDIIVGKGFDYHSSDDEKSEDIDMFKQDIDDYDDLVADVESDTEPNEASEVNGTGDERRPDHFSRIDPKLLHFDQNAVLAKEFPLFPVGQESIVELEAGQVLYLPASWFHEVTSMNSNQEASDMSATNHIALNYWYYPPDCLENYENPYQDDFWKRMTENA